LFIVDSDILANRRFPFSDAWESAAPNPFVGEFGKPSFHEVGPRTVGWSEMSMEVRAFRQRLPDDRRSPHSMTIRTRRASKG
jgi:hypothetical protein